MIEHVIISTEYTEGWQIKGINECRNVMQHCIVQLSMTCGMYKKADLIPILYQDGKRKRSKWLLKMVHCWGTNGRSLTSIETVTNVTSAFRRKIEMAPVKTLDIVVDSIHLMAAHVLVRYVIKTEEQFFLRLWRMLTQDIDKYIWRDIIEGLQMHVGRTPSEQRYRPAWWPLVWEGCEGNVSANQS